MLNGRLTRLRPMEEGDLLFYSACMSNSNLAELVLGEVAPSARELASKLLPMLSSSHDLLLTIENQGQETIGFCFLRTIHSVHGFAELEQFFIVERFRGRGYAEDAIRALTSHCFTDLGLNRIWLIAYAYNWAARGLYAKCGFQEEGVLRQIQFNRGAYHDGIMMALLRRDWSSLPTIPISISEHRVEVLF